MTRSIAHKSTARREGARVRAHRRATQRRFWRTVRRAGVVLGLFAVAALIILAYRTAGGGGGSSSEELVSRPAPDFTLPTLDGGQVTLSDFQGQKNVLLFFNEGYGCAPCWQQAVALQEDLKEFSAMETEVFAVMVDQPSLLASEAQRWGLTLPILVDQSTSVSQAYDALGGMHANKPDHQFILIGKDGVVRWSQNYPSMSVGSDQVVQQVRSVAQP